MSLDHRMWDIFWKLWPTVFGFQFPKCIFRSLTHLLSFASLLIWCSQLFRLGRMGLVHFACSPSTLGTSEERAESKKAKTFQHIWASASSFLPPGSLYLLRRRGNQSPRWHNSYIEDWPSSVFSPEKVGRLILKPYMSSSLPPSSRSVIHLQTVLHRPRHSGQGSWSWCFNALWPHCCCCQPHRFAVGRKRIKFKLVQEAAPRQRGPEKWSSQPVLWPPPRLHATTFTRMGQT